MQWFLTTADEPHTRANWTSLIDSLTVHYLCYELRPLLMNRQSHACPGFWMPMPFCHGLSATDCQKATLTASNAWEVEQPNELQLLGLLM